MSTEKKQLLTKLTTCAYPSLMYDANIKPPQKNGLLSEKIRGIPAGRSLFVPMTEAMPDTVRTLVSRISREFKSRSFQTAKDGEGIRIWRTT
jgi:hypothetical protein